MSITPPRLAIWLLTRRLSTEWRDFVLGDLEEEFVTRCAGSRFAAHTWFWWQTVRCLAAPPPVRSEQSPAEPSPGDSKMRTLAADLRYALRVMSRTPSFAVAVITVLALGIGANTAIFSIVNAVLLRPIPFEEPERLVRLFHTPPQKHLSRHVDVFAVARQLLRLAARGAIVRRYGDISLCGRIEAARRSHFLASFSRS